MPTLRIVNESHSFLPPAGADAPRTPPNDADAPAKSADTPGSPGSLDSGLGDDLTQDRGALSCAVHQWVSATVNDIVDQALIEACRRQPESIPSPGRQLAARKDLPATGTPTARTEDEVCNTVRKDSPALPKARIRFESMKGLLSNFSRAVTSSMAVEVRIGDDTPLTPAELVDSSDVDEMDRKLNTVFRRFVLKLTGTFGRCKEIVEEFTEIIVAYKRSEQRLSMAIDEAGNDDDKRTKATSAFYEKSASLRERLQQLRSKKPQRVTTETTSIGIRLGFGLIGGLLAVPIIAALPILTAGGLVGIAMGLSIGMGTCGPAIWDAVKDTIDLRNGISEFLDEILDKCQERMVKMEEVIMQRIDHAARDAQHKAILDRFDARDAQQKALDAEQKALVEKVERRYEQLQDKVIAQMDAQNSRFDALLVALKNLMPPVMQGNAKPTSSLTEQPTALAGQPTASTGQASAAPGQTVAATAAPHRPAPELPTTGTHPSTST